MAFLTLTVFWDPSLNPFLEGPEERERPGHGTDYILEPCLGNSKEDGVTI